MQPAESLLAYRRMGATANGAWVEKASLATVDSMAALWPKAANSRLIRLTFI